MRMTARTYHYDVIQECLNYCNLKEPPAELEPIIRRKVKAIIDYEAETGGIQYLTTSIRGRYLYNLQHQRDYQRNYLRPV